MLFTPHRTPHTAHRTPHTAHRPPHPPTPLATPTPTPTPPCVQVPFRLRVKSRSELAHPLLQNMSCSELMLPERADAARGRGTKFGCSRYRGRHRRDGSSAGQPSLSALQRHTPDSAAQPSPGRYVYGTQLWRAFRNLQHIGLRCFPTWPEVPPVFPASLQSVAVESAWLHRISWLPSWHLRSLKLSAAGMCIVDEIASGPHSCDRLAIRAGEFLVLSVRVLSSFANCKQITLHVSGRDQGPYCGFRLEPLPDDLAWLDQQGMHPVHPPPAEGPSPDVDTLLRVCLRMLAPLFAAHSESLCSFHVRALDFHIIEVDEEDIIPLGRLLIPSLPPRGSEPFVAHTEHVGLTATLTSPATPSRRAFCSLYIERQTVSPC